MRGQKKKGTQEQRAFFLQELEESQGDMRFANQSGSLDQL